MLAVGDVIAGRYQVESMLGRGGMAEVWKVRHTGLGSLHALKLLTLHRRGLAKRLLLEGQIQARIRHPNVVAVTDLVEHDGAVGLVMEYVDHLSLQAWLDQRGPLDPTAALELFAPVLSAVVAAHDQGVLHRDLKPSNVLLARGLGGLVPKVADFGIAKVYLEDGGGGATVAGTPMGTPGYMAPEQIRDSKTVDARADLFSLGAVLYALLTGRAPFEADDDETSMRLTLTGEYAPIDAVRADVPPELADAIRKALAVDPADRFSDARGLARALYAERGDLLAFVEHVPEGAEPMMSLGMASLAGRTPRTPQPPIAAPQLVAAVGMGAYPTLIPSPPPITLGPQPDGPGTGPTLASSPPTLSPSGDASLPPISEGGRLPVIPLVLATLGLLAALTAGGLVLTSGGDAAPAPVVSGAVAVEPGAPVVPVPVAVTEPIPAPAATAEVAPAKLPSTAAASPVAAQVLEIAAPPPAPTPVAALEVTTPEPAPIAVVTAVPPPVPASIAPAVSPRVVGKWTGMASGRPLVLEITSQEGDRIRANTVIQVGAAARTVPMKGTVDPQGRLVLDETGDGGLRLEGKLDGGAIQGTYGKSGGKMLPFSAAK